MSLGPIGPETSW